MLKITALIVTHNRLDKLKVTLTKTLQQKFYQIIVVNCGSTDGTDAYLLKLKKEQKRFDFIDVENIGGAGGFSIGAEFIVKKHPCDWVVFFDDDAIPDSDFIQNLTSLCKEEPSSKVFVSHVRSPNDNLPIMNCPLKQYPNTIMNLSYYILSRRNFMINQHDLLTRNLIPVETGSFVGFTINFDLLARSYKKIKGELFIYYDDLFYSYWLSQQGHKLFFSTQLRFLHDIQTNTQVAPWKIYFLTKNIIVLRELLPIYIFIPIYFLKLISSLVTAFKTNDKKVAVTLWFSGIKDGLMNVHRRFNGNK